MSGYDLMRAVEVLMVIERNEAHVPRQFRFGTCMMAAGSRKDLVEKFRRSEGMGYDVIGVADHVGLLAPFPSLMLAAEVTSGTRLATTVLNAAFYRPSLLARDAAAIDLLTEGRLELGLGAGYARVDFDSLGTPVPTARQRVDHLERTVSELRRIFANPNIEPQPAQRPGPPVWVAGHGYLVLEIASRAADIIGFSGNIPVRDRDTPRLADLESIADRVTYVRKLLGNRIEDVEFNINVWRAIITKDRRAEAARLASSQGLTADNILGLPTVLIGTAAQIVEELVEYRERFGFTYFTVPEYDMDAMEPVIGLLR